MEQTAAQHAAAEHTARVAALFDRVSAEYDRVGVAWFVPVAERLVAEAAPRPGERALDVGCGRGAALFPLAAAVGPAGRVTGIDLAEGMVAATRADVAARRLDATVDVQVMDAMSPTLPDGSYDLVVAAFVLFFLPDPTGALRAWRRLLGPGGRAAVTTFGEHDDDTWRALDDVFAPHLPSGLRDTRNARAMGPFASDAGVEELFTTAGYVDVRTVAFDAAVSFAGVDEWRAWSRSHGQRAAWDAVPADRHDDVAAAAAAVLDGARGADGRTVVRERVRVTVGSRPAGG